MLVLSLRGVLAARMEALGILPDAGSDRFSEDPPLAVPVALGVGCMQPCTQHGVCDEVSGTCLCQLGWGGTACERDLYPACRLAAGGAQPALHHPCESMRLLSPVACECLSQCVAAGHEICAPHSFGCQTPWRAHARRIRGGADAEPDMGTRQGFYDALTCLALPAHLSPSAHSGLPAPSEARLMHFGAYLRRGYDASAAAISSELPAFGAGERHRDGKPAGAVYLPNAECPSGCSGRGRCIWLPGGGGRGRRRRGSMVLRGGGRRGCVCADGAYGDACEFVCDNDCFNDCSGHGECVHGWCRCHAGWFGVDCSSTLGLAYTRASLSVDRNQVRRWRQGGVGGAGR